MSNNQIVESVLDTADRKAVELTECIPADRGVARKQVPTPRRSTALKRRPNVGVRAAIVERAISIAVAGQKTAVKNNHFVLSAFLGRKIEIRYLAPRREDYWTGYGALAFAVTKGNSGQF